MKQITFDEMLISNDLPPVGTVVTTPRGDKATIIGYSFTDKLVVSADFEGIEITWYPEQVRLCTWEGRDV